MPATFCWFRTFCYTPSYRCFVSFHLIVFQPLFTLFLSLNQGTPMLLIASVKTEFICQRVILKCSVLAIFNPFRKYNAIQRRVFIYATGVSFLFFPFILFFKPLFFPLLTFTFYSDIVYIYISSSQQWVSKIIYIFTCLRILQILNQFYIKIF